MPSGAGADDAPLLWPGIGTNVAHRFEHAWDEDVLAGSDVVVRGRFVNQRLAPVPMEANGIAVVPDGGRLRRLGLDADPVRRPGRSGGAARGRSATVCTRSRPMSAVGSARRCSSTRSTSSSRGPRSSCGVPSVGSRRGASRCCRSGTVAGRCSTSRSARGATARWSACAWTSSRTWARIRWPPSCRRRRGRCSPASTGSRRSRTGAGRSSRTPRPSARTEAPGGPRPRRASSGRWTWWRPSSVSTRWTYGAAT